MKRGFTLVEILVTMTLMAIVIAIGGVAVSGSLKNGRDGRRNSDLKAIQNALEQYYGINNKYPTALSELDTSYLPKGLPRDPKYSIHPNYQIVTLNATTYEICVDLENIVPSPMVTPMNNGQDQDNCIKNQQ